MLRLAILFFVIAIVAAVFGFSGLEGTALQIGKILALVFVVLAVVSMIMGRRGGGGGL